MDVPFSGSPTGPGPKGGGGGMYAPTELMKNPQLGSYLGQAGYSMNPGRYDPYWFNRPGRLEGYDKSGGQTGGQTSGQTPWSTPGLLTKGFPDPWYTEESLNRSYASPVQQFAEKTATPTNASSGYNTESSPWNPPTYSSLGGLQNNSFTANWNPTGKPLSQEKFGGVSPGFGMNTGGGYGDTTSGAGYQASAGSNPWAVYQGMPASAWQGAVANQVLYNMNAQANRGYAPSRQDAVTKALTSYNLPYRPLYAGGRTSGLLSGYVADLPRGTFFGTG